MFRTLTIAALICTFSLLSGCATIPPSTGGECYNKSLTTLLDSTDLIALFQDMAAELCDDGCHDCPQQNKEEKTVLSKAACSNHDSGGGSVLVTDFADIQTFQPNQSGLLMGELMRASLNKVCCNSIVQAEFGKYFKLSENGLIVLTRKASEIKKDTYSQPEAIVGTYNYLNNNKVIVFVRKINTETGRISRMVSREIQYTCGGRSVKGYQVK